MTVTPAPLEPNEVELKTADETLWRQVHPSLYINGKISSSTFAPKPSDEEKLSCNRSTRVSAQDAYEYHTKTLLLSSIGVATVTIGDVTSVDPLRVIDDHATAPTTLPPGHCYVDFRGVSSSQARKKAKLLAHKANAAGLAYP